MQTYASIAATSAQTEQSPADSITTQPQYANASYYFHSRPGHYGYWPYQGTGNPYGAGSQPYPYGYYATAGSVNHSPYMYNAGQYQSGQLNWQRPYQGPRPDGSTTSVNSALTESQPGTQQAPANTIDPTINLETAPGQAAVSTESIIPQVQPTPSTSGQITTEDPMTRLAGQPGVEQGFLKELVTLSSMQPSQIADVLRDNPQLREIFWAAIDQAKKGSESSA